MSDEKERTKQFTKLLVKDHLKTVEWWLSPRTRKEIKRRARKVAKRAAALEAAIEFKRLCNEHTHCTWCHEDMKKDADEIPFCDDCCCGSCGGRKAYPKQRCC